MAEAAQYFAPPDALARFNLAPLREIDVSWRNTLPLNEHIDEIKASPQGAAHYSYHLLMNEGVEARFFTDFARVRSRLALMPTGSLQSLLLYVGVALRGGDIRREIDKARRAEIKAEIGSTLFNFATRVAPLYGEIPSLDIAVRNMPYPARCLLLGTIYSIDKMAARDKAYLARFCWKLPHIVADQVRDMDWSGECAPDLPPVVRRIIKDRFSEWRFLFER